MAEENSDKGFTDMLGDLGSYLMQPDVLLPGVVGGLLTGEAYGRLSDIGRYHLQIFHIESQTNHLF